VPPARRAGVHSLDRFNFSVPDLEQRQKFYSSFGLDLREERGALHVHTHGHPHHWGSWWKGQRRNCSSSPSAPSTMTCALSRAVDRMRMRASTRRPASNRTGSGSATPMALRLRSGLPKKARPTRNRRSRCLGRGRSRGRSEPQQGRGGAAAAARAYADLHPRYRHGHHVLRRALGLRLSDRSGDMIAFMHAIHAATIT